MAETASFVCSVENTKCPVSEDLRAISRLSSSRISPITMISGSWRSMVRRALLKSSPAFSLSAICCTSGKRYSMGSSAVMIFLDTLFISFRAAYKVVDFPLPVGPVSKISPKGW